MTTAVFLSGSGSIAERLLVVNTQPFDLVMVAAVLRLGGFWPKVVSKCPSNPPGKSTLLRCCISQKPATISRVWAMISLISGRWLSARKRIKLERNWNSGRQKDPTELGVVCDCEDVPQNRGNELVGGADVDEKVRGEIGCENLRWKWTARRLRIMDDERRKAGSFMRVWNIFLKINH